jgi:hypothetical protein
MRKRARPAIALTLLLLIILVPAQAEEKRKPNGRKADPLYRATATRAIPGTPELDGRLDDPAWARAEVISDFVQRDPSEGEAATERTEARILYDDGALYIGIRAFDSDPSGVVGQLTRRDHSSPSDWLTVSIDSYRDRRTAFSFSVNPAGVERDEYLFDDTNEDDSWNAVWDVATRVDEGGWVAEFRIPFSQLRFSKAEEQVWGFNITRVIQRKNETVQWKPIAKDASGWVSEFGELVGINGIQPPRRIEVLPYTVATQALTPEEAGNPFRTGTDFNGSVGADVKFGLTNSLTLNVTLNPDFGQVEADPSVVNLSAFETFFSEKRPFFLEGANIFRFGLGGEGGSEQLFYSRRIGRQPQGDADDRGGYVDTPQNTTIIGAGKLSGKTANGWSIGLLNAVTAEESALVIDSDSDRYRDVVEPLTNYGVLRVQRDFNGGRSAFGGILTTVNRRLTASLEDLRSAAYAGGVDGRHRLWGGDWEITGQLLLSHVRGSPSAISDAQTSSARYFQRPDADHLDFDPDRTSLAGTSGSLDFAKIGGGHWRGSVGTRWITPGFEVNDLGFQRQADIWRNSVWIGYREFQPGKVFRRYNLNFNLWNWQTFGGERVATGSNINGNFTLLNYWGGFGGVNREFAAINTRVLRGGPSMEYPSSWNWWAGVFSDSRKPVAFEIGTWSWFDAERSSARGYFSEFSWRPASNLRVALGPEYDRTHDDWQYVSTEDAAGSEQYILGVLDQKTLSLTTRLDWTFTPNLSLQLYAQPFVSAGEYTAFSRAIAPGAAKYNDRFDRFGPDRLSFEASDDPDNPGTYRLDLDGDGTTDIRFDDPDFNFKQLRSTVVLRWEYRAGSTIFLVWSQSRTAFDFDGRFEPIDNFDSLRRAKGDNIFSLKVNYYLNP